MKHFIYSLYFAAALLLSACQQATEPVKLHIIHTNDTHSQFDPVTKDGKTYGGVVERAAMLEYWRQQDPELMYFDAGDMVQGTPYYNIYKGEVEVKAMNLQKVIASTFGNHEFDNGIDGLTYMLSMAEYPILSCNYDVSATTLAPYVKRSLVIQNKGVKIGLTGLTVSPEDLIFTKNVEGVKYLDPVEETNKVAAELHQQGCDLVIVLSHLGLVPERTGICDTILARQIRNVDLIISAHTHRNIENGLYVNDLDGRPVLVTQTGAKASPMGFIELTMVPCKGDNGQRYQLLVDSTKCSKLHPEDYDLTGLGQEMTEFIRPWHDSLEAQMNEILGTSAKEMGRRRPQSLLGNFTADVLVEIGERISGKHVDMGFMNIGGLRSDMPEGDLTLGTIFSIYPFENALCILEVKGSDILETISKIAGKGMEGISRGFHIELKTVGTQVQVQKVLFERKPIDPDKTYTVCTQDYLAEGNGGFAAFSHAKRTDLGQTLRDAMIEYIKDLAAKGKACDAKLDDRIISIGELTYREGGN